MSRQAHVGIGCRANRMSMLAIPIWLMWLAWPTGVAAQSTDLIVDILTAPNRYWNKTVTVKGHIRSVTANPPGTNRGSYVIRDSSDVDVTVLTDDLPAQGREYTVTGVVEQSSPGDEVPFIRESTRRLGTAPAPPRPAQPPVPAAPAAPAAATPAAASPVASVAARNTPASVPAPAAVPAPVAVPPPAPAAGTNVLALALVGVLAVFSLVLVVIFWPRRGAVRPQTRVASPVAAPSVVQRPVAAAIPGGGEATRLAPPRGPVVAPQAAAKATELYIDLGAELVAIDGPDRGKHFVLTKPRIGIGRAGSRQNEVMLTDDTTSREHAKIIYSGEDQSFRLINESSSNPVRVNGKVCETLLLKDSDVIQLGATSLKFQRLVQRPGATAIPSGGEATRLVPPRGPVVAPQAAAKATELYIDLGAELVAIDGPDRGKHFVLTKPHIGIGRAGSRQNEVMLTDDTTSREHAKIVYSGEDQSFTLINESSSNPVRVNGKVCETLLLKDGDVIQLGATSLKFQRHQPR